MVDYSPALMTDMYEYTMLDASLKDGTANRKCVFEVYTRHLPEGRRYGVVAGIGRILDELGRFLLSDEDLRFLSDRKVVSKETISWLENLHFSGSIKGYREGEMFFPNSPILQVEGTFGECTLLETLVLSVLNYDSAVASAASRMVSAAKDRPCMDMGGRRTNEWAAVAAARAAVIGGFQGTANLLAAQLYGLKAIGTAAHCFTLVHDDERSAFASQVEALGTQHHAAGGHVQRRRGGEDRRGGRRSSSWAACASIRGDLAAMAQRVRNQLDALGATNTKITVTNDLDEYALAALQTAPVDSYGVGTMLVTGSGAPTCAMVYKLTERENSAGDDAAGGEEVEGQGHVFPAASSPTVHYEYCVWPRLRTCDLRLGKPAGRSIGRKRDGRTCWSTTSTNGDIDSRLSGSRRHRRRARTTAPRRCAELPITAQSLMKGEPVIPTEITVL